MSLSHHDPAFAFSGAQVAPSEIDRYEIINVVNPIYGTNNVGTFAVAGTSAAGKSMVFASGNVTADYPRNLVFRLTGTAAALGGTATIYGYNQFGVYQTEAFGNAGSDNGGTYVGTKVWAVISAGTLNYGTAVGNGTAVVGFGTAVTTTLIGLPFKVGGTNDLKILSCSTNHVAGSVPGQGTLGAFLNVAQHAILAPLAIGGTAWTLQAWLKPTYNASTEVQMANLTARV
jgi:hypothetical protein